MASGDKIRVALQADLEETNANVTSVTTVVGDSETGLVADYNNLDSRVTNLEDATDTIVAISGIYDADTTMVTVSSLDDGFYIWTETPADLSTYLSGGTANDIWQLSGGTFTTYLAYDNAETSYPIGSSGSEVTYIKSAGSWVSVSESGSGATATVEITKFYTSSTTLASITTEGYYIWTSLPSDGTSTVSEMAVNDILYYDGSNWEIYQAYADAPASIYNLDDEATYIKVSGEWTVSNNSEVARVLDYGFFYLSSAVSLTGTGTFRPFDTSIVLNGDITLGTNGVNLIGGRTYKITYSPYINSLSSTSCTLTLYNYTTSSAIDPSRYIVAVDSTASVVAGTDIVAIFTPESDCQVCVYSETSSTGTFVSNRGNTLLVQEIPSESVYYLPTNAYKFSNSSSEAGQVLTSTSVDSEVEWSNISTRELDYGYFSLSSNVTVSSTSTGVPVDTAEVVNGDISYSSSGINLIAGRTYDIAIFGKILRNSTSNVATWYIYDITNSTEISQEVIAASVAYTSAEVGLPYARTIYTPSTDCAIGIYNSSANSLTCYADSSTVIVKEIPTQATSFLDPSSVEVTNNTTATENQILVSNGDDTATFSDDITVNGTFTVEGAAILSGGASIVGQSSSSNKGTGYVGGFIRSTGTRSNLVSGTIYGLTSITLPSGIWEVTANIYVDGSTTTSSSSFWRAEINQSGSDMEREHYCSQGVWATNQDISFSVPSRIYSLSSSDNIYLTAYSSVSVTATVYYVLTAVRLQ